MTRRARVIGAGMAGLSAAVELARGGFAVSISEGAAQAGGRCRSYHDPQLGRVIDNGNHLVLSGNDGVAQFLATIGASDRLAGPDSAEFDFADRRTGERWSFRPNDGRLPWWIFSKTRRVPGTTARDYLRLAALTSGKRGQTVADRIETRGVLWERLLEPVLLAALNTAPADGDATLTAAIINQTLGRGGKAMKPRIAEPTLAAAFVDPATEWLAAHGASLALGHRLRAIGFDSDCVTTLDFGNGAEPVAPDEAVILAVPAWIAESLVPDLTVPDDHRAIVNAHFAFTPPPGTPPMVGVIGGTAEWIFAFPDRLSVTVSGADRLIDADRAELAAAFWADIAAIHKLPPELPRWQIVKEKRATFAATPAQERRRPPASTRWRNLFLAGDWTQTGLPATIEGALRSGVTAARLAQSARLV
ncbi:hydroxysqualene dehydroxylase HpnE [Sphingomonas sp. H39-1-10]|uniref:hydroxysqualene dehydroxylase HpnE n=1 Tax=Sphingomonas pollutisoli TaxID=3030829 RepID=UPI0023B8C886|nr:hydroxysqualene dehydroxylase HpnE [Sphingomonas pollutisoli]MDF0487288.1 hydroxysqualene dehydroxylase HpnE [Sphingomonas pollutisoli]